MELGKKNWRRMSHLFSILAGFFLGQKLTYIHTDRLTQHNTDTYRTVVRTEPVSEERQSLRKSLD